MNGAGELYKEFSLSLAKMRWDEPYVTLLHAVVRFLQNHARVTYTRRRLRCLPFTAGQRVEGGGTVKRTALHTRKTQVVPTHVARAVPWDHLASSFEDY